MGRGILFVGSEAPDRLLERISSRMGISHRTIEHLRLHHHLRIEGPPQLVIVNCDTKLEIVLADIRNARSVSEVPLLALVPDRTCGIEALRSGADSVVSMPVNLEELCLKIGALQRRAQSAEQADVYDDGELRLDRVRHSLRVRGAEIRLTPTEFRMLAALLERPGTVKEREQLREVVWGDRFHGLSEVKLYISYLRRKLGQVGVDSIETVRGVGYRYRLPGEGDPRVADVSAPR